MSNYGPARQARQKIETSSYWKFIEVTHSWNSGHGRGIGLINILLKLFFFEIPDLVHRRTAAPIAAENRRTKSPIDGATNFLATIWLHIITVSFV